MTRFKIISPIDFWNESAVCLQDRRQRKTESPHYSVHSHSHGESLRDWKGHGRVSAQEHAFSKMGDPWHKFLHMLSTLWSIRKLRWLSSQWQSQQVLNCWVCPLPLKVGLTIEPGLSLPFRALPLNFWDMSVLAEKAAQVTWPGLPSKRFHLSSPSLMPT